MSSFPVFPFMVIWSLTLISRVSCGMGDDIPISSPSQSRQILLAKVVLPEFGGPYSPSLKFCRGPKSQNCLKNAFNRPIIEFPAFFLSSYLYDGKKTSQTTVRRAFLQVVFPYLTIYKHFKKEPKKDVTYIKIVTLKGQNIARFI